MEDRPLTNREKEKKVLEALQQRKSVREISKAYRVSFTYIGNIRRKHGMDEPGSSKLSIRSKALKLIREGKTDLDLAIQLNLSANQVLEYRKEFLILNNEDDLLRIYPEIKNRIQNLLILLREMELEEITEEEAVSALIDNRTFKYMTIQYEVLRNLINPLRQETEALRKENQKLKEERIAMKERLKIPSVRAHRPRQRTQKEAAPTAMPPWFERETGLQEPDTDSQEGIISLEDLFSDNDDDRKST